MLRPQDFCGVRSPRKQGSANQDGPLFQLPDHGIDFENAVSGFELSLLRQALAASGGNKTRAASLLRIKRTTLLAKMKVLGEEQVGANTTSVAAGI